MKIELKIPMLIGTRSYQAGDVVDCDDYKAKELVELNHATSHIPTMQTADVQPVISVPAPMQTADVKVPRKATAPKGKR